MILSAGVLLVKILGAIYKIPLTNMIGEVGMGYFNTAYQLYLPVYTLATAGFPVAVARMVSEYTARNDPAAARGVFRKARRFFLCSGLLGTLLMAAGAMPYARFTGSPGAVWSIWALAPTVLLCCLMGPHRGYRTGLRQMEPAAISQVIEAAVRLFVGLGAAAWMLHLAMRRDAQGMDLWGNAIQNSAEAFSAVLPLSAAGATAGVSAGALCAWLWLVWYDRTHTPEHLRKGAAAEVTTAQISRIALPVCAGALVVNIGTALDAMMMQNRLNVLGTEGLARLMGDMATQMQPAEWAAFLYGSFSMAQNLAMLVPAFAQAIGTSALPAVAAAAAVQAWDKVQEHTEEVLFWTSAAAFPAGIGLAVMAKPVLELLYHARPAGTALAIQPLTVLGIASVGMTLSVPVNSMLQALGREKTPLVLLISGVAVKAAANYRLIGDAAWHITGAAVGTLLCYTLVTISGLICLKQCCPLRPRILRCMWAPAWSALLCGGTAWGLCRVCPGGLLGVAVPVFGGGMIYVLSMLLCSGKKIRKRLENRRGIR
jgi:stage V sporulation protein B